MADPLTILLFVAAGEGSDATTRAIARATREALGSGTNVEVQESANEPGDDEAIIAEQLAHADAIVDLIWSDTVHRNAALRVHVARTGRWIRRSIGFMPSDAPTERGRTIGFAVVSMLPEASEEQSKSGTATSGPNSAPTTPPAPGVEETSERDRPFPSPGETRPPNAPPVPPSFALELSALGTWGVGGDGSDTGGGGVNVHWFPRTSYSLWLGGAVRGGTIDSVQSSTLVATASAGFGWHPVRPAPSRRFGVSLRADYVVLYESLQYQAPRSASGAFGVGPVARSRPLSGAEVFVDVAYLLAPDVEGMIGLGLEYVFGLTHVTVPQALERATFPALRLVFPVGVRVRF